MHEFSSSVYTSQDFAQTQKMLAQSHNRMTVTFRSSGAVSCKDFSTPRCGAVNEVQ